MLNKFLFILEKVHLKVFGHEMSLAMKDFLGHLSWSFFGIAASSLILFLINVLAGRIMGPEEYGNYNFVLTIAYALSVLMIFGQDLTVIKYVASSQNEKEKNGYISNAFGIVFVSSVFLVIFGLIFADQLSNLLGTIPSLFLVALAYAIIFSFRSVSDSFLRALYAFKSQSYLKIVESIFILLNFLFWFVYLEKNGYQFYIISLMAGFLLFVFLVFYRKSFSIMRYDKKLFVETYAYSKKTLLLSLLMISIASVDKLFVGKFIGMRDLGIYSAYLTTSVLLVSQLVSIFSNAFFPMISGLKDKHAVIKKIDKLSLVMFIPGVLCIFLMSFVLFKFFGKAYELNFVYLFLFAVSAFFQLSISFYRNIAISSEKAYASFLRYTYVSLILFLGTLGIISQFDGNKLMHLIVVYTLYNFVYMIMTRISCSKSE